MQKFFCAGFFLLIILILQDCLIPAEGVRIRVVKVKKQPDAHYTKRQASRSSYTDVPLAGDPDPEAESFRVNTNNLRPEENPYNAGNRHVDYPSNNNVGNQYSQNSNNNRYNNQNNNQNNNNNRYEGEQHNQEYAGQRNYNRNSGNSQQQQRFQPQPQAEVIDEGVYNNDQRQQQQQQQDSQQDALRPRPVRKETEKDGDCPGCGHNIPGDAGVDYPNYHTPPKTTFTCSKQSYSGYYADVEARCQVFWICQKNRADAFLCPNGTIFNQQVFVCDWWFNSDCNTAPDYYSRNQYLYAGPTVDLFGNPITPHNANNNPFNNRNPSTQPIRRTAASSATTDQPERLSSPIQQQQQQPPQHQQQPQQQQQQQQQQRAQSAPPQSQVQRIVPQNTGNAYNNNNRNFPATTSRPPLQQQKQPQGGYSKRSQQSFSPIQNKLDYNHDDRLKQPFNYPVPDNSLAAVDGEFGLKMDNNYKSQPDYIDQRPRHQPQTYHHTSRQSTYPGHAHDNDDYNANRYVDNKQHRITGGYSDSQVGYTNKQDVKLQRQYQPVYSSTPVVSSVPSSSSSGSINAVALQGVGYGMKTSATVKRNPFIDSNVVDKNGKNLFSSRSDAPAATTKRNAIDYDTENTTPYASSSFDEELLATLTTPRYAVDAISKPIIYSTEIENSQSIEVTTAAPLTFGEKLTRAAKKRSTSRWGNWRTLLNY